MEIYRLFLEKLEGERESEVNTSISSINMKYGHFLF